MKIPKGHPRQKSLHERHALLKGMHNGIVSESGLVAHGRGEAFDYLLGERTTPDARKQIRAAAAMLLLSKKPVISVNGNATALCAREIAELSKAIPAKIEVNLFYRTKKRTRLIAQEFRRLGLKILGTGKAKKVPGLRSKRQFVDKAGIWAADVVLVMLEDGDRTEFLKRMGKKVIAIDLNPLSRTSRMADITIVDNITRAVPLMSQEVKRLRKRNKNRLSVILNNFKNKESLAKQELRMRKGIPKWMFTLKGS